MPLRVENAIDMHCHFCPDVFGAGPENSPEGFNPLEAARFAQESGHRAVVLKSHSFPSVQVAATVQAAAPEIRVFGGICTDQPTGGMNVFAVEMALRMGAKIVWLPTVHSHQDYLAGLGGRMGVEGEGIKVVDGEGRPTPELQAIFDLVRQYDGVLATGHTSAAEHYVAVRNFARDGKVLVTHAGERMGGAGLSPQQCRELADLGAVIELTALTCTPIMGHAGKSAGDMARMIQAIGCSRCTLSTDYGWSREMGEAPRALSEFMEELWKEGLSEADLTQMAAAKPAEMLGL
jgi:hypothetical protein